MKIRALLILAVVFTLGCNAPEKVTDTAHSVDEATFKKAEGLFLPEKMKESLGLKIEEVAEGRVASTIKTEVYVFGRGPDVKFVSTSPEKSPLATGTLSKEAAERIREGAALRLQGRGGEEFQGRVVKLHQERGLSDTEVLIEVGAESLPVGTPLTAVWELKKDEEVVTIPAVALLKTADGNFVYTVNGTAFMRTAVTIGERGTDRVEVKDGLYAGDKIVTEPVMSLWLAELQFLRGGKACSDGF